MSTATVLLEVAGAVGVLIGFALRPLGIAAAAALPAFAALALAIAVLALQGMDA